MAFLEGKIPLTRIVETRPDGRRRARTCLGGLDREHRAGRYAGRARAPPRSSRNARQDAPACTCRRHADLPAVHHGRSSRSTSSRTSWSPATFGMKVDASTSSGSVRGSGRTRRGEIEYGVKALPLGGYVKIAGMNPYEEVPPEDLPRTLRCQADLAARAHDLRGPRLALRRGGDHLRDVALLLRRPPRSTDVVIASRRAHLERIVLAGRGRRPAAGRPDRGGRRRPGPDAANSWSTYDDGAGSTTARASPSISASSAAGTVVTVAITPELDRRGRRARSGGSASRSSCTEPIGPRSRRIVGGVKLVGGRDRGVDLRRSGACSARRGSGVSSRCCSPTRTATPTTPPAWWASASRSVRSAPTATGASILYFFAFVTVFIGLINLRAAAAVRRRAPGRARLIEKVRGKAGRHAQADPRLGGRDGVLRRLREATMFLDITKPIPIP